MANEKWSQKPLITEISNTTEFCILDEAIPKNKRINAKALLDAKANSSTLSSHTSNTDNPHSVTKTQVGLGNVDNTSDASKPISQAVQSALDSKAPLNSPTFTGVSIFSGSGVQFDCPSVFEGNVSIVGNAFGENEIGANKILANEMLQFGPDAVIKIITGYNGSTPVYREFPATELASSDLNGTQYVMVYGVGTPSENAAELQAAYDAAKNMPRYFGSITSGSIQTVYAGQTLYAIHLNAYYKIITTKTGDYYTILGSGNSVEITESEAKSTRTTVIVAPGEYNFGTTAFVVDTPGINIVSLTGNSDVIISSTEEHYDYGYTYGIKVNADFTLIKGINCKTNTFHIGNYLDNLICEYCTGGDNSFGGNGGFASGSNSVTVSGTFNHCTGGYYSFGGGNTASGTFNYCIGSDYSFGGDGGTLSGELINCKLTSGEFPTPTGEGKIYNSIDGSGNLINTPLPIFANNDAAASLAVGAMYRTLTGVQMIKY